MTKVIKLSEIRRLAKLQCTEAEAAGFLGISRGAFKKLLADPKVKDAWEGGQMVGKISLRRKQFRLADDNASMAMFLGKQILGQRDVANVEIKDTTEPFDVTKLDDKERKKLRSLLTRAARPEEATDPA